MRLESFSFLSSFIAMNLSSMCGMPKYPMTAYDREHYAFHEIFFQVCPNLFARRILNPIKNRLWDFPRKNFVQAWYLAAIDEHALIIDAIESRNTELLVRAVRDLHWDFAYNEPSIRKVYGFG